MQEWVPVCWVLQVYGDHGLHSLGGLQVAGRELVEGRGWDLSEVAVGVASQHSQPSTPAHS